MRSSYLFTSESVSEGHPDKVADQISDAIVDLFLSKDPEARVACETMTTTNAVVLENALAADFTGQHDELGGGQRLAGDAGLRVFRQEEVNDRVGNLVGNLVGMPFGHGLGGEEIAAAHRVYSAFPAMGRLCDSPI